MDHFRLNYFAPLPLQKKVNKKNKKNKKNKATFSWPSRPPIALKLWENDNYNAHIVYGQKKKITAPSETRTQVSATTMQSNNPYTKEAVFESQFFAINLRNAKLFFFENVFGFFVYVLHDDPFCVCEALGRIVLQRFARSTFQYFHQHRLAMRMPKDWSKNKK